MYSINIKKKMKKKDKVEGNFQFGGFIMSSSRGFKVNGEVVRNVKIINSTLAKPIAIKAISNKYNKLIGLLTELIISDDDSGNSFTEALNQIEKFRMEVKNKYRSYLEQEQLDFMAKQLGMLQREAKSRFIELQNSFLNEAGKSR